MLGRSGELSRDEVDALLEGVIGEESSYEDVAIEDYLAGSIDLVRMLQHRMRELDDEVMRIKLLRMSKIMDERRERMDELLGALGEIRTVQ